MKRGFLKGIILLVILLFFSGPSFSTEEGPAIWLFAAQPERYFSAFLEIHLKRVFSTSQLQFINLYSKQPGEMEKKNKPKIVPCPYYYPNGFFQRTNRLFFSRV
jgi:hypothetical protein